MGGILRLRAVFDWRVNQNLWDPFLANLLRVTCRLRRRRGVEDASLDRHAVLRGIESDFAVHRFPYVAKSLSNSHGQTACLQSHFTGDSRPAVAIMIFDLDLNRFAHVSPFRVRSLLNELIGTWPDDEWDRGQ
jgi:hypothetical protein